MANRRLRHVYGIVTLVALLLGEEVVSRALGSVFLPPASEVGTTLWNMARTGALNSATTATVSRMLIGFFLTLVLAIPFGVLLGWSRNAYRIFEPTLELLRPLPVPSLVPVTILFLGVGYVMNLSLIVFATMWPILLHTIYGVRGANELHIASARVFQLSKPKVWRSVLLPGALPEIFLGIKIALPIAFVVALLSEMIAGSNGLGQQILVFQRSFRITEMFATTTVIAVIGLCINGLLDFLDGRLLGWHYQQHQ